MLTFFGPPKRRNPLQCLKGINASSIPPCESELAPHIRRVAFVARQWVRTDGPFIDNHPQIADGWKLIDNHYYPVWFDGPQMPDTLVPGDPLDIDGSDSDEGLSSDDEELTSSDET